MVKIKKMFLLLSLACLPMIGYCESKDEQAAVQLVHDYYRFVDSYADMPNAEFDASRKFDHPDAAYNPLGGDSETYEIVDEDYKIVKVVTTDKKTGDVEVTVRFKTYGYLDLFKDGFEDKKGSEDVTFVCSRSKGKYLVMDLDHWHIRFYGSALKYLKEKTKEPKFRWKTELKGLRQAHKGDGH